jgi:hypothetical protein
MKTSTFNVSLQESSGIVVSLKAFLYANGYMVQEFRKSNGLILQVKKGGRFKKILGLAVSLNLNIDFFERYFTVSFSEEKWAGKVIVACVGLFFLWPLLITVAVGAYKQVEFPNKIVDFLNSEVNKTYSIG